jgi:hypothetical protein
VLTAVGRVMAAGGTAAGGGGVVGNGVAAAIGTLVGGGAVGRTVDGGGEVGVFLGTAATGAPLLPRAVDVDGGTPFWPAP